MRFTAVDSDVYVAEKVDIRYPSGQMYELRLAHAEWFSLPPENLRNIFYLASEPFGPPAS
jgi:hypothetical protein